MLVASHTSPQLYTDNHPVNIVSSSKGHAMLAAVRFQLSINIARISPTTGTLPMIDVSQCSLIGRLANHTHKRCFIYTQQLSSSSFRPLLAAGLESSTVLGAWDYQLGSWCIKKIIRTACSKRALHQFTM